MIAQHCASGVWCVGRADLVAGQGSGTDPIDIGGWGGMLSYRSCRLVPFWLVAMMDGWGRGERDAAQRCWSAGGGFAGSVLYL
ncbi:hypothetical protein ACLK10_16490 [Escherichia coli]